MSEDEKRSMILSVAGQVCAADGEAEAMSAARLRNWLDQAGVPTQQGADLIASLQQQAGTRTVFRGLA